MVPFYRQGNSHQYPLHRNVLVEVDSDMVRVVQERIRELQGERDRLKRELDAAKKPKRLVVAEFDRQVANFVKTISRLRQSWEKADAAKIREFLQSIIGKVVVQVRKHKHGRRHRYELLGGEIHLQLFIVYPAPSWTHM